MTLISIHIFNAAHFSQVLSAVAKKEEEILQLREENAELKETLQSLEAKKKVEIAVRMDYVIVSHNPMFHMGSISD